MRSWKSIQFSRFNDYRGSLVVGENGNHFEFAVNRFFFLSEVPENQTRGQHAHRQCHQLLIPMVGKCELVITSRVGKDVIELDSSSEGLYLPPLNWIELSNFSPDALILVLASHAYDPEEYIISHEEFLDELNRYD